MAENDLGLQVPPLPDESGGPEPVEGCGPGGAYEPTPVRSKALDKGFAITAAIIVSLVIVAFVRSCS